MQTILLVGLCTAIALVVAILFALLVRAEHKLAKYGESWFFKKGGKRK